MSRKIHQDKSTWKLPTIYSFCGGYGPYRPPKDSRPIEGAVVMLWNSAEDGDSEDGRQPMYSLASHLQQLLLDDEHNGGEDRKIFLVDLHTMFDENEKGSAGGKQNQKASSASPGKHSKRHKTPTTTKMTYLEALKKEEESLELTKGFGKVILKLLQRMLFQNITLVAKGAPLSALSWKLHAALNVMDPEMIAGMWMILNDKEKLSTKFVKTQLVVHSSAFSSTQQNQETPLHLIISSQARSRVEMMRYFFPTGSMLGTENESKSGDAYWLGAVLLGENYSNSEEMSTSSSKSYDPDCINALGKSLFLSVISVEMNRYTKQYQRESMDITAELAVVETKEDDTPATTIPLSHIDWSTCERQVGALVLRGNRCVLVRSLEGKWTGMRIPSVTPKENESPIEAAMRAVVEFTGVDARTEVTSLSELIQPVQVFGPNGRPTLVQLVPLYATEPPPDGPLEDADMEDDETPYDWYLYENALRKLSHDPASVAALQIMALSLIQAANAGLMPTKWGGVFGQEISLGLPLEKSESDGTATTASPGSSLSGASNDTNTANTNSMLQVEIEEWKSGLSNNNPDAELMKEVQKANEALLKRLEQQRQGNDSAVETLPVTLLSGFLGSGKTTLLAHILSNAQGLKVAVLVNDMGEINIDAAILKQNSHISIQQRQEHMVELSNGCICCTLREDLLTEVAKIAASEECYDYLVIESSGISEPLPVAETFTFEDTETGLKLGDVAELDTLVTVIDGARFFSELNSLESLQTRNWHADPEDQRTISHLLCDQVEFSNVIVLNKCDQIDATEKATVKRLLQQMNSSAAVVESSYGKVPLDDVLGTRLFSMEKAEQHEGWLQEARIGEHTPETEEYGISSFTYRARKPFYPHKFHQVLQLMLNQSTEPFTNESNKILRAKGFVWLTSCQQLQGDFSLAGNQISLLPGNPWWAEIDKADWPKNLERDIAPLWQEPYGDRQQEIVWIGQALDPQVITAVLNECVVSDADLEAGPDLWNRRCEEDGGGEDPFQDDWQAAIDELLEGHNHDHDHHHDSGGRSHSHSHEYGAHCQH